MFEVGDRVRIVNDTSLIREVRGQSGTVRRVFPIYLSRQRGGKYVELQNMNIELDNGAQPSHIIVGEDRYYLFNSRNVELVAPREPDWEI